MDQAGENNFNTSETMLSARKAAEKLSCSPDYVSKLCREGKLDGVRENNVWVVSESSIEKFKKVREEARLARSLELSQQRKAENKAHQMELFATAEKKPLGGIASPFKGLFTFNRVGVAVASVLFFAAVAFAGTGSAVNGMLGVSPKSDTASVAQVQSPFFGNSPFAFFAALFAPKSTSIVATATDTPINSGSTVAQIRSTKRNRPGDLIP